MNITFKNNNIVTCVIVLVGLFMGYISTTGTKTQAIRLLDIFLIGPLMIYFGQKNKPLTPFSILLIFFGATTIMYNLKNYVFNSK